MVQMSIALSNAHLQQYVHLDIKPENILVEDNKFFLADFGISKYLYDKQDLKRITEGDGRYCAKELLSD